MPAFFLLLLLFGFSGSAASERPSVMEDRGFGLYYHDEVGFEDYAEDPEGFWLFQPQAPYPDSSQVIVFLHGYGAYNPLIYGAWIRHLVRNGHTVVFPRYQKNLWSPHPAKFVENSVLAIREALAVLDTGALYCPKADRLILVGHSYGGTIAAHLSAQYAAFGLPKPAATLLCAPGTGPFRAGRLKSYETIPADTKLVIIQNDEDRVVGKAFQRRIFETAYQTSDRWFFTQYPGEYGLEDLTAGHNECYGLDPAFDTGSRTPSVARAFRVGQPKAVDYFGYWRILDDLIDCSMRNSNCDLVFGPQYERPQEVTSAKMPN